MRRGGMEREGERREGRREEGYKRWGVPDERGAVRRAGEGEGPRAGITWKGIDEWDGEGRGGTRGVETKEEKHEKRIKRKGEWGSQEERNRKRGNGHTTDKSLRDGSQGQ